MLTDAVLAEYASIRNEIMKLNGQIFAAFSSSLGLNATILGWLFSKEDPTDHVYLAAVGSFVLLLGNILSLNLNRLAHRLAYFQSIFIEDALPDIRWARTYFRYRKVYDRGHLCNKLLSTSFERIAEGRTTLLASAQALNMVIALLAWSGCRSLIAAILCIALLSANLLLAKKMTDYTAIEEAMKKTFHDMHQGDAAIPPG